MTEQNNKYDLSTPYQLLCARIRQSIFFLQYSHSSKATLDRINNFSESVVFNTKLTTFSEEELQSLTNDYKLWTRHNIINYLIEESVLLFLAYKYWIMRVTNDTHEFKPEDIRNDLKDLMLNHTSMKKAITDLESTASFKFDELSKNFFLTLYDMRNSLTHHQGYALKSEIHLSYIISRSLVNNEIFELSDDKEGLTIKDSFPNETPDENDNIKIGIKHIVQTMIIDKDYFIGINYKDTVDILYYFSIAIGKIWKEVSKELNKYILTTTRQGLSSNSILLTE